jgi:DNA-binding response OmpR family regulator
VRVAALMRRQGFFNAEQATRFGDYTFTEAGRLVSFGHTTVTLRRTEFRLALFMFRNAGRVVTREELTKAAGCRSIEDESRTLDTHLSRIRRALRLNQKQRPLLRSIYGQGYFLALDATLTPSVAAP